MLLEKALSDIDQLPHVYLGDSPGPRLNHPHQRNAAARLKGLIDPYIPWGNKIPTRIVR
jgi:hypothetical protein